VKNDVFFNLKRLLATKELVIYFIQKILGCEYEGKVLAKSQLHFNYRPLFTLFLQTEIDNKNMLKIINQHLGLPEDISWPRNRKGRLRHPKSWTRKFLKKHYPENFISTFIWLRKLIFVHFEAMIDIPQNVFFLIKARKIPFSLSQIERAYTCGELLKKIKKYNTFKLITITTPKMVAPKEKVFKALDWQDLEKCLR